MVLKKQQVNKAKIRTQEMLKRAGIVITPQEFEDMEVADFDLDMHEALGLQLVVYVNTDRVCAKELVLFPHQICPEHWHPPRSPEDPGKEETFRCRWGEFCLYVPGEPTHDPSYRLPPGKEDTFTVFHEIHLLPGEQYTLTPNTKHWFQAGPEGAVISEFSTTSTDDFDQFTDPKLVRKGTIIE